MRLALALLLVGEIAHAGPYSDLIVFGDSLSDVGNVLGSPLAELYIELFDGGEYYEGRFSNGPVYAERLSAALGLGGLENSLDGGDNFAYGGAETDGPNGFFEGLFVDSLVDQVDDYLARLGGASAQADALHVVWAGANNFLIDDQTDPIGPARTVGAQMQRLAAAGVRQFLGVNLPLLGLTPSHLGDAALSQLARAFNVELGAQYDAIELAYPDVTIHRLDVESLFNLLTSDPAQYGFLDTTTTGESQPGDTFDRATGYAFWDGVHPTRELHALLGEVAASAVLPTGDYDRDGVLSAADDDAWRAAYGTAFNASLGLTPSLAGDGNGDGRIDAADYTLWRDALAARPAGVPEPAALRLLVAACFALPRRRVG